MIKKICAFFVVLAFFGCGAAGAVSAEGAAQQKDTVPSARVIAYYFHGNFRCPTCKKLETYSREAVEQNFGPEISSGKVVFKPVNTDEKANQHFVSDYGLYTKSVVLSLVRDGKEIKNKNLSKIWELVGNKKKYFTYVKDELDAFVKEL